MVKRKSMIHLITACNSKYTTSAEKLGISAYKHGVNNFSCWDIDLIAPVIKRMFGENPKEENRGWFYIWKPYVIWEVMQKITEGDILIYSDAGQLLTDSVKPLIDKMDENIMLFNNPWKHIEWCKADIIDAINQIEVPAFEGGFKIETYKQVQASFIIFRVCPDTINFVKEWMLWCMMPGFCDNSPSYLPNFPTFQEHRWDQAVLTCLQIKYAYNLHPFPSVENMDAPYRIINHHRKTNDQW